MSKDPYILSTTHNGLPKQERYHWNLELGDPGRYESVNKNKLSLDKSYQRDHKETTVDKVSKDFNWAAFGTLIVFEAPDGTLSIVDGGNRWMGAMRRNDVTDLPCQIFKSRGAAQEAKTFLEINTGRRPVSAIEKHKAALLTGDPLAVEVETLITQSGRVLGKTSGLNSIHCVARLRGLLSSSSRTHLQRLWPLLVEASTNTHLYEKVVDGLVYLESNLLEGSLTDPRWWEVIVRIGAEELNRMAIREAQLYSKGGARVWGIGMMHRINKGKRHSLLKLKGSEATNGVSHSVAP